LRYLTPIFNCVGYIAMNGSMAVNNELEGKSWPFLKYSSNIMLEVLRKLTKNIS